MVQVSIVTEEVRQALKIGEEAGPFTYEVDRSWIRRFATALADPNPLWHYEEYARQEGRWGAMTAPPSFFAALDPIETRELQRDFMNLIPYKRFIGANAFNEVEYFQPIRVGDVITVTTVYTNVDERDGKRGRLLFPARENVLKNQHGELVARSRGGHVIGYDLTQRVESAGAVPVARPAERVEELPPRPSRQEPLLWLGHRLRALEDGEPRTRPQLHYEDVQVGAELPALVKYPTTEQSVRYAAASNTLSWNVFDYPFARRQGFRDVILNGLFKVGFLAQLLADWAGPRAWVKKLAVQYRGVDHPFDTLTCKGKVTGKHVAGGEPVVEVAISLENGKGEVTIPGTATVFLPTSN